MKSANTPRQIYVHANFLHLSFEGRMFGIKRSETSFCIGYDVTVKPMPSDGGRQRLEVTQRYPNGRVYARETWRTIKG